MKKRFPLKLVSILIASAFMLVVALPSSVKSKWPNAPILNWIKKQEVTLGLDLQGGSQLTYNVDLSKVYQQNQDDDPENDQSVDDVVRGVQDVLEKRTNGMGVSEPRVFSSNVGDEKHIIVELAGINDLEEAKKIIGKTIQLEFKELKKNTPPEEGENTQEVDPDVEAINKKANELLAQALTEGTDFIALGEKNTTFDNKIELRKDQEKFISDLSPKLAEALPKLEAGQVYNQLLEGENEYTVTPDGQLVQRQLTSIIQLKSKEIKEKTEEIPAEAKVSEILIAYKGAENAGEAITRTKEEAQTEANRILEELKANPEKFAEIAKASSNDSSAEKGGDMGFIKENSAPQEVSKAAFAMETGTISETPVESKEGYHILQVNEKKEASTKTSEEEFFVYNSIVLDKTPDPWKSTGLDGSYFKFASVGSDNAGFPIVNITFNSEGAKLFEEITERLVGQPLAIFVGGNLITAPNVNEKITGGVATISGNFDLLEAHQLASDLNTGAIAAPVIPVGENTISASLGENALKVSLIASDDFGWSSWNYTFYRNGRGCEYFDL